ncbi:MAG TPA: hypothetical protein VMV92_27370 [Streptosporangiaceae bacterium]|nr:hypothetical protein [Streptosporangiaceae bacterium]
MGQRRVAAHPARRRHGLRQFDALMGHAADVGGAEHPVAGPRRVDDPRGSLLFQGGAIGMPGDRRSRGCRPGCRGDRSRGARPGRREPAPRTDAARDGRAARCQLFGVVLRVASAGSIAARALVGVLVNRRSGRRLWLVFVPLLAVAAAGMCAARRSSSSYSAES